MLHPTPSLHLLHPAVASSGGAVLARPADGGVAYRHMQWSFGVKIQIDLVALLLLLLLRWLLIGCGSTSWVSVLSIQKQTCLLRDVMALPVAFFSSASMAVGTKILLAAFQLFRTIFPLQFFA